MIHDGEELDLRDSGPDRGAHGRHGGFGASHGDLQAFDLLGRLHGAHGEDLALAILDPASSFLERKGVQVVAAIEPKLHRPAAVGLQQIGDLIGEGAGAGRIAVGDRRPDELGRPRLIDGLQDRRHMIALRIFEEHNGPIRGHKEIAGRVA